MITTILLDVGGTIYIKKTDGMGVVNPAISYLNTHLPKTYSLILLSDTDEFDVPDLLHKTFPELHYDDVYTKMLYPWIDKTRPQTYLQVCELIQKKPEECVLIDNLLEFRTAAETAGIKTCDVDQNSIEKLLQELQ